MFHEGISSKLSFLHYVHVLTIVNYQLSSSNPPNLILNLKLRFYSIALCNDIDRFNCMFEVRLKQALNIWSIQIRFKFSKIKRKIQNLDYTLTFSLIADN